MDVNRIQTNGACRGMSAGSAPVRARVYITGNAAPTRPMFVSSTLRITKGFEIKSDIKRGQINAT